MCWKLNALSYPEDTGSPVNTATPIQWQAMASALTHTSIMHYLDLHLSCPEICVTKSISEDWALIWLILNEIYLILEC